MGGKWIAQADVPADKHIGHVAGLRLALVPAPKARLLRDQGLSYVQTNAPGYLNR
jgi:hypothetical protein